MRILYLTRSDSVHDQRFMAALAESGHEAMSCASILGTSPPLPRVLWT